MPLLPPHLGFLKICEGCLHKCSYCAIPIIKGKLKSKYFSEVLKEAKQFQQNGVQELNVIGQDITSWGKDLRGKQTLVMLLQGILKETKKIPWVRLVYTHPRFFSDELIDLIAQEKRLCKYVDLPIQHCNNRILKAMNRHTTKKDIVTLIKKIRDRIPGVVLRSSVIVGFPTETEKEFKELLEFLNEVKFERLGAFSYSQEEGTPASKLPQLHHRRRRRRLNTLMSLQREVAREANKRFLGQKLTVLVEEEKNDILVGRSQYDAYDVDGIVYIQKKNIKVGTFCEVTIMDSFEYDLIAQ
jgi:ribosomal protein S12 methylthiotransferase